MTDESSQARDVSHAEVGRALLDGSEFTRLHGRLAAGGRDERGDAARLAIERTMLEMVGERGYAGATLEEVVERSGSNRARFYASFGDKESCYATAYETAIEALAGRLLGPCAEAPDWPTGVHAALLELARFLDGEPAVARGLIPEAIAAEASATGTALAIKQDEVFGRLSRAIDRARRETIESRHPVPPFTPRLILSGIEGAVSRFLGAPEGGSFADDVPGLLYLAVDFYLGPAAARAQVRRLCERDA